MNYDSFEENLQVEEIIPEEYEDWLRYCAGAYEKSENEAHDDFEDEGDWFEPGRHFVSMFELNP